MAVYKLNDIAPIQQGTVPTSDEYWLLNLDMVESNSGKVLGYNYVSPDQIGASTVSFDTGNVLYSKLRPYLNKVVLPMQSGYATSEMVPLRPNTDIITREYLTYLLRSPKFVTYINSKTSGAKMPRAKMDVLKKYEVDCPPIQIQYERTLRLDENDISIDICHQEIDKHDQLIKARFVEMFGDPVINPNGYPIQSMADIASYWNGLTYKPEDVSEEGTIVLRSSNIQNMQLDFADTVRVSCKIGEKKYVQENDILMCSRNGSAKLVGKVALIKGIDEPMSFGAFMMIIRSDYYPYLMTYFQMPAFRTQIVTGATTTINQITGSMMDKVFVPVPDRKTMNEFAALVAQVDKSKAVVQGILDKLNTLQASLMQEYFG